MRLLNPFAFLYVLPIILVLLLTRRQVVRIRRAVSTQFLWDAMAARDANARTFRWRRQWLLIVQAALMATLMVALAHPLLTRSRGRVDLVIDLSASMGAHQGAGSRLDLARQALLDAARSFSPDTTVSVWTSEHPEAPIASVDADSLKGIVDGLRPSDGPARLPDLIAAIRTIDGTTTPIYVFTDTPPPSRAEPQLEWITVGQTVNNLAITALSARQLQNPAGTEVVVGFRNFGGADVDAPFEVRQDDMPLATDRLRVPAHGAATTTLRLTPTTGVITARLQQEDGLDADNVRFAVVPSRDRRRVLLATPGNFFLERVLGSNPGLEVEVASRDQAQHANGSDLVVCDGCDQPPADGAALVVTDGAPATSMPLPLHITGNAHPLMRFVDAAGVSVIPVSGPPLGPDDVVLARAGNLPVIVASDSGSRRVVSLRMQIRDSSLALSPAFPILISNIVAWLTREGDNPNNISAGTPLAWFVTASEVSVRDSAGVLVASQLTNGHLSVAPLVRAGVYTVESSGARTAFVVNPDTSESDLQLTPPPASTRQPLAAARVQSSDVTSVLLLIGLLLLAAEAALNRPLTRGVLSARAGVATLLVIGLVAPRIPWGTDSLSVLFLLDRSASMPSEDQSLGRIRDLSKGMRAGDKAGLVVFGGDAAVERTPDTSFRFPSISSRISTGATNIAAALQLARTTLGTSGARRAVLVSDGNQTTGDSIREATLAAAAGIPVDVVPVGRDNEPGGHPSISTLHAPAIVRKDEPFDVTVEVRGRPGTQTSVDLRRDSETIATLPVSVGQDGTGTAAFTERLGVPSLLTYTVASRFDGVPDGPAEAGTVVTVTGSPAMLYVGEGVRTLLPVFSAARWQITTSAASALPDAPSSLHRFDAVVLDDVAGDRLSPAQIEALNEYVTSGGGMLALGRAATLSGLGISPLSTLLPVDLRPHTGQRGPGMALVLAFDKSGSMADAVGGITKIELARQAVIGALKAIPSTDLFGAIAFDSRPVSVAPLDAGTDAAAIAQRLRALDAGGSTSIAPAIDLAESWLQRSGVSRRRVLLVSDGRTAPADVDRLRIAVRSHQFELSVVAIGDDADRALLTSLAADSGGRAYFPSDVSQLPTIVARDAAAASTGTQVSESFAARVLAHPVTQGIDPTRPPMLGGYVVSSAKPGAEVMLASHLDDPLLVGWRVGLGRVAAFTSDLQSTWTRSLREWPAAAQLWTQTARWVGRRIESADAVLTVEPTQEGLHLLLTCEPSGPERIVEASARVHTPTNVDTDVQLDATAPGRYEASMPASVEGPYTVLISTRQASGADQRLTQGVYWASPAERPGPPDLSLLTVIARRTGGRVLGPGDTPFASARPGAPTDIRPVILNLALLAFMSTLLWRAGFLHLRTRRRVPAPASTAHAA